MPKKNKERQFREDASGVFPVKGSRWSNWYTALVPKQPDESKNYKPRKEGHDGAIYIKTKEIFRRKNYDNGIYELSVSKPGRKRQVVYIGAAHRDGLGSLDERIEEYCWDGSHAKVDELINRAMKLGYKLSVRAKNIRGPREHVYECEDKYLARYNYAWNKRSNGRRRKIPPRK